MLTDDNDVIAKKIKKAKTDAKPLPNEIKELESMPEAKNLITIFAALTDMDFDSSFKEYQGKNFSEIKKDLVEVMINKIGPIREEMLKLENDKKYLHDILESGSLRARKISQEVLREVYEVTGLHFKG
jgi:tryptophanyl-tRNA synthetase